jgi:surfeit locus 1 family protein
MQTAFRPSLSSTIALLVLAILFANLGMWQTKRATEKLDLEQRFASADIMPLKDAVVQERRFAKVSTMGNFDTARHLLLDNQMYKGRVGVHVYTPFYANDGSTILVNRGWLPLAADRMTLPQVPTPDIETMIYGRLNTFPVPGRLLGAADQLKSDTWPQLVTYLNHTDIVTALGSAVDPWIIQLDQADNNGFKGREWTPVFLTSQKHNGYAFQWYAMTAITLVLWVTGGIRRANRGQT